MKPRKRVVKGWVSESDYEIARGYSYLHYGEKPVTDIGYTVTPCVVYYTIPQKKRKK